MHRKVQPQIVLTDLQPITELFPTAGFEFPLDPSYEPESNSLFGVTSCLLSYANSLDGLDEAKGKP
jgi:hypothetical protein